MKKVVFFAFVSFLFVGCLKDKCEQRTTYLQYERVYVTPDEYRSQPITYDAPQELQEPGKIYFYRHFILINEVRRGIHIIDNADPTSPVKLGFIHIEGNHDISVMNDVLYADAYSDLVIMDISNIQQPVLKERVEDVFSSRYFTGDEGLLSHLEPREVEEVIDCSDQHFGRSWFARDGAIFAERGLAQNANGIGTFNFDASGSPQMHTTGQGGSMARFTITKHHLYVVGDAEIFALPIYAGGHVGEASRTPLPWGIETIFPYEDYLFIGAINGMHIMTLDDPGQPKHASTFSHANACDPVVVQDNIAYVTLRGGTACGSFTNQLDVLDVTDIFNPKLLHTFAMDNPHGLAVVDNDLFICEGNYGLKVFDVSNISAIKQNLRSHIKGFHAFDAIAIRDHSLLVIGHDGFRQYDFSDPSNMKLMSLINVTRP